MSSLRRDGESQPEASAKCPSEVFGILDRRLRRSGPPEGAHHSRKIGGAEPRTRQMTRWRPLRAGGLPADARLVEAAVCTNGASPRRGRRTTKNIKKSLVCRVRRLFA